MFRLWLVILSLFTKHFSRDVFIMASDSHETCSAPNQRCGAKLSYPKLVRLDGVQIGRVQNVKLTEGKLHQLITKSLRPLLFEIPDFLTAEECEHIIKLAGKAGLSESTTLPDIEDETALNDEEMKENCQHLLASDGNSNGKVSALELGLFINQTYGLTLDVADVEVMLKKINFDKDGDGEINLSECMEGDHLVFDQYMRNLEDSHPRHRIRLSQQTWLRVSGSTDPVLRDLQERTFHHPELFLGVIRLTNLPRVFIEHSEDLQVVQYGVYGHYHAHYDSSPENDPSLPCCHGGNYTGKCSLCRFLTILYYLNDVPRGGETAFPVADEDVFNQTEYEEKDLSNLSTHCYDANLVVRPVRGTAIMWYNHMINNVTGLLGAQDERSLHGGCDVLEGHKWIANNWISAPFEWTDHV